ncbi:MAG: hypothetical protein V1820_02105 [archaeon]
MLNAESSRIAFNFPQGENTLSAIDGSVGSYTYYNGGFPDGSPENELITLAELELETAGGANGSLMTRGNFAVFLSKEYSGSKIRETYLPLLEKLLGGLSIAGLEETELSDSEADEDFCVSTNFCFISEQGRNLSGAANNLDRVLLAYQAIVAEALYDKEISGDLPRTIELSDHTNDVEVTAVGISKILGEVPTPYPDDDYAGTLPGTPPGVRGKDGKEAREPKRTPYAHLPFEAMISPDSEEWANEQFPGRIAFYDGPILKAEYSIERSGPRVSSVGETQILPVPNLKLSGEHRGDKYVIEAEFDIEPQDVENLKEALQDYGICYIQRGRTFKFADYLAEDFAGVGTELRRLATDLSHVLSRIFPLRKGSIYFVPVGIPVSPDDLGRVVEDSLERRERAYQLGRRPGTVEHEELEWNKQEIVRQAKEYVASLAGAENG